jgi:hypothetical protein
MLFSAPDGAPPGDGSLASGKSRRRSGRRLDPRPPGLSGAGGAVHSDATEPGRPALPLLRRSSPKQQSAPAVEPTAETA